MQKKRNVLASKLRPMKTVQGEKMLLYKREGNSTTTERMAGAIYDKDTPLTTSV